MLPWLRTAASAAVATMRRRTLRAVLRHVSHVMLLACACGGMAGPVRAEDAVLVASTAPGYARGMVLTANERLVLPDGASVTLLFRSGQMLRLRGPVEASLDLAVPVRREGTALTLVEAFRLRGVDASVIGGTRRIRMLRGQPQDVAVEAQRSGTYCVGPADTVWLTRPAGEPGQAVLRRRGNLRTLAWSSGATRVEWPSDVLIEDGDHFDVLSGETVAAALTFRTVATTDPADPAVVAEGMLLGCREQYDAALRRLASAAVPPEVWLASDRGRRPSYRPGEAMGLSVMAAADGWLYCVRSRGDGTTVPIFPAGAVDGARVAGSMAVAIPGPRRAAPLLAGPLGVERIRCWLADRDIAPELPNALLDSGGGRLPERLAGDLEAVFARISGNRIATAELEIRVEH